VFLTDQLLIVVIEIWEHRWISPIKLTYFRDAILETSCSLYTRILELLGCCRSVAEHSFFWHSKPLLFGPFSLWRWER